MIKHNARGSGNPPDINVPSFSKLALKNLDKTYASRAVRQLIESFLSLSAAMLQQLLLAFSEYLHSSCCAPRKVQLHGLLLDGLQVDVVDLHDRTGRQEDVYFISFNFDRRIRLTTLAS